MNLYRLQKSYRFIVLGVIGIVAISVMAVTTPGISASNTWAVNIHADGEKQVTTTDAETVGEVLDRSEITLGENDIVEPEADTEITSNSFNINVYRSRPVIIVDRDNDERYKVESAHQSDRLIAENSEVIDLYEEDNVDSELVKDFVNAQNVGYKVMVERATPLNLKTGGNTTEVRTQAETVGGMLEEKDIDIDEHDVVKPGVDTPIEEGMNVSLTRISFETTTREIDIDPPVEEIKDNDRPIGYREVEEAGRPGRAAVTYEVEYKNGEEVNRKEIRRVVKREPEKRVVVVGNKFSYDGGPLNEEQMNALGFCESGMTADRVSSGDPTYYGAFQFLPSTWRSVNNTHSMPHEAPLSVQKEAVQSLLSNSSIFTQFPSCAKQMRADGIL